MTTQLRSKCPVCKTEYISHPISQREELTLKDESSIMHVSCHGCGNIYNPLVKGEWL